MKTSKEVVFIAEDGKALGIGDSFYHLNETRREVSGPVKIKEGVDYGSYGLKFCSYESAMGHAKRRGIIRRY